MPTEATDAALRARAARMYAAVNELVKLAREPIPADPDDEPPPGSVLLLHGTTGTAVQRMRSDGTYRSTAGRTYDDYIDLFQLQFKRPPLLIYRAPEE